MRIADSGFGFFSSFRSVACFCVHVHVADHAIRFLHVSLREINGRPLIHYQVACRQLVNTRWQTDAHWLSISFERSTIVFLSIRVDTHFKASCVRSLTASWCSAPLSLPNLNQFFHDTRLVFQFPSQHLAHFNALLFDSFGQLSDRVVFQSSSSSLAVSCSDVSRPFVAAPTSFLTASVIARRFLWCIRE